MEENSTTHKASGLHGAASAATLLLATAAIAALGWFGADLVLSHMTESICYEELAHYGEYDAVLLALAFVGVFVWSAFAAVVVLTMPESRVWLASCFVSVVALMLIGAWQAFIVVAQGMCM